MRTNVVTGAAGEMGTAIREYLEGNGEKVVGVDVRDAEVVADMSTEQCHSAMIMVSGSVL